MKIYFALFFFGLFAAFSLVNTADPAECYAFFLKCCKDVEYFPPFAVFCIPDAPSINDAQHKALVKAAQDCPFDLKLCQITSPTSCSPMNWKIYFN